MSETFLTIKNLVVHYELETEVVEAVNNVSLSMQRGETLGIVGETGAGKTSLALSIMQLIPDPPGKIIQGAIELDGEDLTKLNKRQLHDIRGKKISMIFQDPMTSLNPVQTVGKQIMEVIKLHENCSAAEATIRAITVRLPMREKIWAALFAPPTGGKPGISHPKTHTCFWDRKRAAVIKTAAQKGV